MDKGSLPSGVEVSGGHFDEIQGAAFLLPEVSGGHFDEIQGAAFLLPEVSGGHFDEIQSEATLFLLSKGNLPSGGTISLEKWWKEHQGCTLDWLFYCRRLRSFALGLGARGVVSSVVPWFFVDA
jgi:hypothetical protein